MMKMVMARNLAANMYRLRVPPKIFLNDVVSKAFSSTCGQSNQLIGLTSVKGDQAHHKNNMHLQELEGKQDTAKDVGCIHDVAIVGGGMVGLAFACSLARSPMTKHLNVAIIDSNPALGSKGLMTEDGKPDARVSTVTPATISMFKEIGAWKYVQERRHAFFDKMQVWDYTGLGYTKYNSMDVNKEVLGCVVENRVILQSLLTCMQDTDLQKTIYSSRLNSMTLNSASSSTMVGSKPLISLKDLVKLETSSGDSLYAKLVVGADGGKSRVRELAGFGTTGWKYSQNAIICTVEHTIENHCAWQRFLPSGPIALLPMGGQFSNIVWTMSPEESSKFKSMNEEDFVKAVNFAMIYGHGPRPQSSSFGSGGNFSWFKTDATVSANNCFEDPPIVSKLASERMVFPLSLMHAKNYASKGVVLIGDAAHSVHPLAGQGVNLGFGDAFALSKTIAKGIAVGTDIGEVSLLKAYEAERKPANIVMMAILDGFQKAYSVDLGPLNILRAAAFHGAQNILPLKQRIISYASGEQRLPLFT